MDVDGSDGIEEIIVEGCSVDGRDVRGRRGARETNVPGNAEEARLNLANRDAVVGTVAGDAEQTGGRIFSGVNDARQKHAVFEGLNVQGPTQAVDSTLLHHGNASAKPLLSGRRWGIICHCQGYEEFPAE